MKTHRDESMPHEQVINFADRSEKLTKEVYLEGRKKNVTRTAILYIKIDAHSIKKICRSEFDMSKTKIKHITYHNVIVILNLQPPNTEP